MLRSLFPRQGCGGRSALKPGADIKEPGVSFSAAHSSVGQSDSSWPQRGCHGSMHISAATALTRGSEPQVVPAFPLPSSGRTSSPQSVSVPTWTTRSLCSGHCEGQSLAQGLPQPGRSRSSPATRSPTPERGGGGGGGACLPTQAPLCPSPSSWGLYLQAWAPDVCSPRQGPVHREGAFRDPGGLCCSF